MAKSKASKTRSPNRTSRLRWIMQFEGINTTFLARRTGLPIKKLYNSIPNPLVLDLESRKKICQVLNRSYEQVFGDVKPLEEIMIARPTQNHVQQVV